MLRTGDAFCYEIADGWTEFRDGPRHVHQGPGGEELIVSAWRVIGPDGAAMTAEVDRLQADAERSALDTANDPELVVKSSLTKCRDATVDCWMLYAETVDSSVLFLQLVARTNCAVLLATFEAPNLPNVQIPFTCFRQSLKASR